jgi:hypothetical protein
MDHVDCSKLAQKNARLPDACLAAAAVHIRHDFDLFDQSWHERHTRLGFTLWFILERSLWDFFFGKRSKDDILATDFPTEPGRDWATYAASIKATAQQVPGFNEMRDAANKNVAHLTYKRASGATETVPSEAVHQFMLGIASEWLSRLTPESRVWFGR